MSSNQPQQSATQYQIAQAAGVIGIIGAEVDAAAHSHHALQISVALKGKFAFEGAGMNGTYQSMVCAPNRSHQLVAADGPALILLIDPHHVAAPTISANFLGEGEAAALPKTTTLKLKEQALNALDLSALLSILAPMASGPAVLDPRIKRVISHIDASLFKDSPLAQLCEIAALSESRLAHLFKDQIGIPIRRYQLWRRLMTASYAAFNGANLTEAAHSAGFSDSAHFTRSFKAMFGSMPSKVTKQSSLL